MRTENEKLKFLEKFRESGSVLGACNYADIPRQNIYRWCKENKKFKEKFDEAKEEAVAVVCDMAELQLAAAVKRGEPWAIRFVLDNNHPNYIKPRLAQPREEVSHLTKIVISTFRPKKRPIVSVESNNKTEIINASSDVLE